MSSSKRQYERPHCPPQVPNGRMTAGAINAHFQTTLRGSGITHGRSKAALFRGELPTLSSKWRCYKWHHQLQVLNAASECAPANAKFQSVSPQAMSIVTTSPTSISKRKSGSETGDDSGGKFQTVVR
ncbi:hypothetical protein Tcan_05275 [Toxocara canis]|uniref:Uncharacterized protein n=1 Tax=Toxocara canis TaxID=6265 RepID=A0A0B2VI48_TOXCA|nr:hypothetical protein Tcan_05275 [Toxocara canis]